jgi:hypothetical protein
MGFSIKQPEKSMTKTARAWAAGWLAAAWIASPAHAAPVVASGSQYSLFLMGESSGNPVNLPNTFDNVPESFTRAGTNLIVSEAETALGGGRHRITVDLSSSGDLFPIAGETGFAGIGIDGNGFDLQGNYFLEDAFIHYFINGVDVFTSDDLADQFRSFFTGAWTGRFADIDTPFSVGNLGGAGVNGFKAEFVVSEITGSVPEPGSLALSACALLAMAATRRRRG